MLLAALAAFVPARAARAADAAQVTLSEGETTLVRGSSYSTPVRADVPIRSGDRIRTGHDGRVQLRFADGALVALAPATDFRIESYVFDGPQQQGFFQLLQGSVRTVSGAIGKRNRDDYRLKTPTATIGIRGTEFTVDETACPAAGCASGQRAGLVVTVLAGRVVVANEAGSVEVPAGATLHVGDARTAPRLAAPAGAAPTSVAPASVAPGSAPRPLRAVIGRDPGVDASTVAPSGSSAVGRR